MLIQVGMQEGKEGNGAKEYESEYGHTTATTLRLTKPWHDTNRLVCGDSWFASKKCAVACRAKGIHFCGIVKTNHAGFPKAALEELCGPEKGDSVLLTTEVDGHMVMALGHRGGGNIVQCYVPTCGLTTEGVPSH